MTINVFSTSKIFSKINKMALLALLSISHSVCASIIDYHTGVDISGTATSPYIDEHIGVYEITLLDAAKATYTRENREGFSVKIERDFFNIESATSRGRQGILLGGDFNSNIAASFTNENARNIVAQRISEKTSFDTLTQVMLSGSSLSGRLDLEIEKEAEQGRPSDAAFYDNLFDDAPYSDFYLDLSFDFTGSSTNDYTVINTALYDALYSFYQDSDVNTTLVAVEHDMAFTLDALSFSYSGSVNRKLWFDNESDAISAQAFFAADIFDMYSTQSHSGWFQHNLLNNNLYKSSYNFSNVQSGINQVASTDPVDVPEPATWLLFLSAALLFMVGKARKHS